MKSCLPGRALFLASLALVSPAGVRPDLHGAEALPATQAPAPAGLGAVTDPSSGGKSAVAPMDKMAPQSGSGQLSVDSERARDLYWEALRCLRSEELAVRERGHQLLVQSASLEFVYAMDYLGHCYLDGLSGFSKDPKKGANWLRLASERGLGFAKVSLAACQLSGFGVPKDLDSAEKRLREALAPDANFELVKPPEGGGQLRQPQEDGESTVGGGAPIAAADRTRAMAHFLLGELYTLQAKHAQAQAEYLLAARQGEGGRAGHYKASIKAALNFAYGRGVARDSRKAGEMVEVSRQLAKRMGSAYARSLVDSKQVDTFAQADVEDQLQRQAQQEERRMAMEVAAQLSNRKSPNYDIAEAFRWLELSVEDGQGWAMISLGLLHLDPKAGRLNPVKARELFKAAADKDNDGLAWGNYAICLEQGIGGEKDPSTARTLFLKRQGEDILNWLGAQGRSPAVPMSYEERLKLTMNLVEKQEPQALFFLGSYLVHVAPKEESRRVGFSLLMKSAELGNEASMSELGTVLLQHGLRTQGEAGQQYLRSAFQYLKRAADKGNLQGLVNLGRYYQDGVAGPKDEDEAVRLYELCLKKNPDYEVALNNMSQIYYARYAEAAMRLDEAGMKAMQSQMLGYLEAADKRGFVLAARNLGVLHYEGHLGRKDFQAAYQHFDDAANRGDVYSRRMLGVMLERGQGLPVSYTEAAYHYRIAALGGDRYSMDRLCTFYRGGLGVSRDPERALQWLRLSLKNGNALARVQIADVLLERGEAEAARKVLEEATPGELRLREFQRAYNHRLGLMYERGLGLPVDETKGRDLRASALALGDPDELFLCAKELLETERVREAIGLLDKAGRTGHREANFLLGQLYEQGRPGSKDAMLAVRAYRQAAESGHREAMFRLAKYSLAGAFGAPSYDEALKLCVEAVSAGVPGAEELRVELERRCALRKD